MTDAGQKTWVFLIKINKNDKIFSNLLYIAKI